MMHILEADSIELEFNGRKILSSVYLKLETGKITALLGRNGAGKTCLMNIIYGSLHCEKSVRCDGIFQKYPYQRPDLLRYLPQFNCIPQRFSLKRIFNDFELEYALFQQFFPEFSFKYTTTIGRLSGGERRLVELYVILKSQSQFAMLDEPFTHLSPVQIEKIKELLQDVKTEKGLLITDHLYQHVTGISDSLYVLANGKTHFTQSMDDIEALGYARV